MTQLSQPRRTNLPRKPIPPEELRRRQQQRDDLAETIIGSFWLDIMRLVADKPNKILTLEIVQPQDEAT